MTAPDRGGDGLLADISAKVEQDRSRGVILDVSGPDVLDSSGTRTLRNIAQTTRLRGAVTVIVGVQPGSAAGSIILRRSET